jgi:epsilon-lactone hydrolase
MSSLQLEKLGPILAANKSKMEGDLDQIRRGFEEMLTQFPPAPGVVFKEESLDGLPGIWCVPPDAAESGVLLYLHGGGYVVGSAKAYTTMVSWLAARLKARVLILDYRLAPENPYPAAPEDALKAYRWLLKQGKPIAIAGDSCGGGLTIATMVAARDAGLPMPAAAALLSPWADLEVTGDSATTKAGEDFILTTEALHGMAGAYLGGTSPRTPGASPVYADLTGLPPLLIQAGATEILLDDATRLATRAGAAGVRVRLDIWPEMFHVWHAYAPLLDEGAEALNDAADFLAQRLLH